MLDVYDSDPVHIRLKSYSEDCLKLYGRTLLDAVLPYLELFFHDNEDHLNRLRSITSALNIDYGRTNSMNFDVLESDIDPLLDTAIESGDNAAEFGVSIAQYLIEYFVSSERNSIRYLDISFLNVSDYIAQEYELKRDHATETEIEQTETMAVYRRVRNGALGLCDELSNDSRAKSEHRRRNLCDEYAGVIRKYVSNSS